MTVVVLYLRDRVTWDKARVMGMEKSRKMQKKCLKNVKWRALAGKEWEERCLGCGQLDS